MTVRQPNRSAQIISNPIGRRSLQVTQERIKGLSGDQEKLDLRLPLQNFVACVNEVLNHQKAGNHDVAAVGSIFNGLDLVEVGR
jgi:hypothetical protein